MGKINAEWHRANKMPKNPSEQERVIWHREHQKHCSCAPVPRSIEIEVKKLNRPL
ncbi:MAG: hypothetical protein WCT32_00505 [Patescibacteria group bacterium]|jgi:hypothetical protein